MTTTRRWRAAAGVVLLMGWTGGPSWAAATFTVNSLADEADANLSDPQCLTASGTCTLRAAVQQANATVGEDMILLPAGTYGLKIPPSGTANDAASGDLDVTEDLTISPLAEVLNPAVTVIDGGGIARVFHVTGGTLKLLLLTLQNGDATKETAPGDQHRGGAVLGAAELTGCIVTQNKAAEGGGLADVTKLDRVRISKNSTSAGGNGGGASLSGSVTITDGIFDSNPAGGSGGGIALTGNLILSDSIVEANSAAGGGGIALIAPGAVLMAQSVTISGNTASSGDGGGIEVASGAATLRNVTVTGNKAVQGRGGGLGGASGSALTLNNVTVAVNTAGRSGGGLFTTASPTVGNTIIAGNTVTDSAHKRPDCDASIAAGGHNLVQDDSGCTFPGNDNITGENPKLDALKDNGRFRKLGSSTLGPNGKQFAVVLDCAIATTPRQALDCGFHQDTLGILHGSPAVNRGNATCEELDQRHARRVGTCDIGAFELQGDKDGDGIEDIIDNCENTPNRDQADTDGDGIGDVCDKCPTLNFQTAYATGVCDDPNALTCTWAFAGENGDGDSVPNQDDCCPGTTSQENLDDRGCSLLEKCPKEGQLAPAGKKCLKCGKDALAAERHDQTAPCLRPWRSHAQWRQCARSVVRNIHDRGMRRQARQALRTAFNSWGNRCGARGPNPGIVDGTDPSKNDPRNDQDFDCVSDALDNCPHRFNPGQKDNDLDEKGNACDGDPDGDDLKGNDDNCPFDYNPDQADADRDGVGDECDDCPGTRPDADVDNRGCSPLQRKLKNKS